MPSHIFACSICKGTLAQTETGFACEPCSRSFDIVLVRLAPLGFHGVPNAQAALRLLKPGGTFFTARWSSNWWQEGFTPPHLWCLQLGYESAETHTWRSSSKGPRPQKEPKRSLPMLNVGRAGTRAL